MKKNTPITNQQIITINFSVFKIFKNHIAKIFNRYIDYMKMILVIVLNKKKKEISNFFNLFQISSIFLLGTSNQIKKPSPNLKW